VGRFQTVVLALLFAGGYLLLSQQLRSTSRGVSATRGLGSVEVETDDFKLRFSQQDAFSDSFMVFGGRSGDLKNNPIQVSFSVLTLDQARSIHRKYPDFHRCKSPGAPKAQRLIEDMSFVATDTRVRDILSEVVKLHEKRIGSGGNRTCMSVTGFEVELESVQDKKYGEDVTDQYSRHHRKDNFYIAEDAEVHDCQTLL
jgi:hypothetical protein